jgi:predicted ABC-type ATPase
LPNLYASQMPKRKRTPRCIVIADLLAIGLSPLKPVLAAMKAGRLVLQQLDDLAAKRVDFAFEVGEL